MNIVRALFIFTFLSGQAIASDADLTIMVDDALLKHGGLVEVLTIPTEGIAATTKTIKLTERYTKIELQYPKGASYKYRFRPAREKVNELSTKLFKTEPLSIGTRFFKRQDSEVKANYRAVRVLPLLEYASKSDAERTNAAWGVTQRYDALPPSNHWGARALKGLFQSVSRKSKVRLICEGEAPLSVCSPDPADNLVLELLWWRSIAESRLERIRHDRLRACYDSGGFFGRPEKCKAVPGRGWPTYQPER